jgi:hypothetical protein
MEREITILQIFSWINVWDIRSGIMFSIVFLFLFYIWIKLSASPIPLYVNLYVGILLFSVAFATASHSLIYETNPLYDPEIVELREQVDSSTVAFASLEEKDLRGRVEVSLAGVAHLLNPYYGSIGQRVELRYLAQLDYVISGSSPKELRNGLEIRKWWGDRGLIATVQECELSLVDRYQTEDTLTFRDRIEVTLDDLRNVKQESDVNEFLYLYKVIPSNCPSSEIPSIPE